MTEIKSPPLSVVQCCLKVFHLCYISQHLLIKSDGCVVLTNTVECFLLMVKGDMHVHVQVNIFPVFVSASVSKPQFFPNQIV